MKFTAIIALLGVVSSVYINTEHRDLVSYGEVMAQIGNVAPGGKGSKKWIRNAVREYIDEGLNGDKYQGCSEGTGFSKEESEELNAWAREEFKDEPQKARRFAVKEGRNLCVNEGVAAMYVNSTFEMSCQAGKSEEVTDDFMGQFLESVEGGKRVRRMAKATARQLCGKDKKALGPLQESPAYLDSVKIGREALEITNKERMDPANTNGETLLPLIWSDELHLLAYLHNLYHKKQGGISHDLYEHISAVCSLGGRWAENVAWISADDETPAASTMAGWMNLPGHRANILNDYTGYAAVATLVDTEVQKGRRYST